MQNCNSTLRERLYIIIFRADTPAGKHFDMLLLGLILTSILLVFLESVAGIRIVYGGLIHTLEWIFTGLFTIEYLLRIYSSRKPWGYVLSFYGLIDLIAILPSFLSLFFPGGQYLIVGRSPVKSF